MTPEIVGFIWLAVSIPWAIIGWWKRDPFVERNPFFIILMFPLCVLLIVGAYLEHLRDKYNPKHKHPISQKRA